MLRRARYHFDRVAGIAPVDLALGWGPMSEAWVLNDLKIGQSGRWYSYRWFGDPPIDEGVIATHSANTHCLPADNVRGALLAVKRHEWVRLTGYLVEVTALDGMVWTSSLTREDTGDHACEIMWVTGVQHKPL